MSLLKKLATGFLVLVFMSGLVFNHVQASGEKFMINALYGHDTDLDIEFFPINSDGTFGSPGTVFQTINTPVTEDSLRTDVTSGLATWANGHGYSGITANDVLGYKNKLATVATTGAFSDILSKPTTISGYGITDAVGAGITVNGHALSGNITVTKSDLSLGNVVNLDTSNPSNITQDSTHRFVSDSEKTTWNAKGSGTVTSVTAGTGLSGGTITSTGTISLPNTGNAGTYATVTTDAQGRVTAGNAPSDSYGARTLNTCFQISASRNALVNYSVDVSTTLSLSGGQTGTVFLETYSDSGCTTSTQEVTRFVNGNTGTLTIGLNITQNVTGTLTGFVPAGKYVKIRTANTTGSPTFTYRSGQEVQW